MTVTPRDAARLFGGHLRRRRDDDLLDAAAAEARASTSLLRALNASLVVRRTVGGLRWIPARELSRLRDRLRPVDPGLEQQRISILCPTRQRVDRAGVYLRSMQRTAAEPHRVELLFYVDDDDPDLADYRAAFGADGRWNRIGRVRTDVTVEQRLPLPQAWNVLAAHASGDVLMMGNDDQLHVTYGWDTALDRAAAELRDRWPDDIWCAYFDAEQYEHRAADFPIVSRRWYESLGYFTWPEFLNWETDRWVFDLAHRAGRIHAIAGPRIEHLHFQDFRAPFDATYQAHRLTRDKSRHDHELFAATSRVRAREVLKLMHAIDSPTAPDPAAPPPVRRPDGTEIDRMPAGDRIRARVDVARALVTLTELGATDTARELADTAVARGLWRNSLQRPVHYFPALPAVPVRDPKAFWFTEHLERHAGRIQAELEQVLSGDSTGFDTVDEDLLTDGKWDQVVLYEGGQRFDSACARFPVLARVMSAIPEATAMGPGVVSLSWLHPGSHIKPHCGRSNAYLRVHLGLRVPGGSRMRVGDETVEWREGRCLVFDDSFEHEVWHEGTEPRIVLLFDVWNPDLPEEQRRLLEQLRPSTLERIRSFMTERDIARIDSAGDAAALSLVPNDRVGALIRRYLDQTGARGARLAADDLVLVDR